MGLHCTIMQQIQGFVNWCCWRVAGWGALAMEVYKQHLDHIPLASSAAVTSALVCPSFFSFLFLLSVLSHFELAIVCFWTLSGVFSLHNRGSQTRLWSQASRVASPVASHVASSFEANVKPLSPLTAPYVRWLQRVALLSLQCTYHRIWNGVSRVNIMII